MRQMIVNEPQVITSETVIDVRCGLVHRQVLRTVFFFKDLRSQIQERRIAVCRGFDSLPANVATGKVIGYCQQFRRG
jgi:hypothetical protein